MHLQNLYFGITTFESSDTRTTNKKVKLNNFIINRFKIRYKYKYKNQS